jgi:alpha-galactosidase
LEWLAALMNQVRSWGFDYLKLDFLFGSALPGKRYQDMPRETACRNGLKVMHEAMGDDAYFLACGAPILPSLGLCDALRIGPDVSGYWEDYRNAVLLYNQTTPSAKNAIRTTLNRFWLNPLVQLDPDAAYFRSVECTLTAEQKSLLQNLALICGYKATSDLPQWLTPDEKKSLHSFLENKPNVKQISRYVFQINDRIVDFNSAISLPNPPEGLGFLASQGLGWLANQKWALRIYDEINERMRGGRKIETT